MNSKLLGVSLAAIFAIAIGTPMMADAITELVKTKVIVEDDQIKRIVFKLGDDLPGDTFGGYAIFTEGDVVAVTKHDRFFDSAAQQLPQETPVQSLSLSAALCTGTDPGCGGEWHTHAVKPVAHPQCDFVAVGALSFQEPSVKVKVFDDKIVVRGVDIGEKIFLDSASSTGMIFTVGNPVDADVALGAPNPTPEFDGAAFDLNPALDNAGNIVAICIGDALPPAPPA